MLKPENSMTQMYTELCLWVSDSTDVRLHTQTHCGRKGVQTVEEDLRVSLLFLLVFPSRVDLDELSLRCLFAAHWTGKGQTSCMLSGAGCSRHGRPGRDQDGISRLCLDDRTPPASPSLQRRPSASASWQPAQHDNRTTKGDEASAVSTWNHILGCWHLHMSTTHLQIHTNILKNYKNNQSVLCRCLKCERFKNDL